MTAEDLVFMGALAVLSASVAYAVGRRRGPEPAPLPPAPPERAGPGSAPSQSTKQAASKPPVPKPASAPTPPTSEEKTPTKAPVEARKPAKSGHSQAAKPSPPAPPTPPTPATGNGKPAITKLYEEDESVDPTKVGVAAGVKVAARTVYQPPLKCIAYDEAAENDAPEQPESLFLVHATAQTDTGLRRKRNEDSVLALDRQNVFVIADGMGGHQGGHLASQTAVKTIADAFQQENFEGNPHEGVPADASNLARAIQMANASILELAQKNPELEGMGTTVCAASFSPNKKRLYIGHVGDSRCYSMRNDVLRQMTADHTMADYGVTGPEAHQLSRAVGIWPTVPIDVITAVPSPGDVYLLCSDGLTKMLSDDAIADVLRKEEDPKTAVEQLIVQANARGGKDNITVILVRVVPPHWKPSAREIPATRAI